MTNHEKIEGEDWLPGDISGVDADFWRGWFVSLWLIVCGLVCLVIAIIGTRN